MRVWNSLWITTMSASPQISDRILNPSWIAMNDFSTGQCGQLYIQILNKFRWSSVFIIIDPGDPGVFAIVASFVQKELEKQPHIKAFVQKIATKSTKVPFGAFDSILKDVAAVSRVILFFGHAVFLRELLITAAKMGMTNGEYVYIAIETMRNKPILGDFNWRYNDNDDDLAFRAYQSLLIVQPKNVDMTPNLQLGMEFIRRSYRDYNLSYNISDQNFPNLISSYRAITATAAFLNESLSGVDDLDYQDGRALARMFLNRTYTDEYGSLYIDNTGQRRTDFVVTYFDSFGIRTPLLFKTGKNDTLMEATRVTEWANSSKPFPPPNEPYCGYSNNKPSCLPKSDNTSMLIAIFTVSGSFIVAAILSIFHWRYTKIRYKERLLHDPWWQVDNDDLKAPSYFNSYASSLFAGPEHPYNDAVSMISHSVSHTAVEEILTFKFPMNQATAVRFASLHGKGVACFPVARGKGHLSFKELSNSQHLLRLLRKCWGLDHQNVCRLYGISINLTAERFSVMVIFACPSRGNLPQMCNGVLGADFTFTSSFVMDFLEGLQYIHNSKVAYHGRLSVFNCWIDKHFTLKLMNLASDRIRDELELIDLDGSMNCHGPVNAPWEQYFWLVPELDEIDQWDTAPKSWQAVDVFSTGFVLYDILTSGTLYKKMEEMFGTATIIYPENNRDNPLEAAIDYMEIAELASAIHGCLSVIPEDRPTVKQLRSQLKELSPLLSPENSQYKLFDKIYRRFCYYSNQLEQEVQKRSRALKDARMRCDALVRQFLPKEIVKNLRAGQFVAPELFDCVTITFAQLDGFASYVLDAPPEMIFGLISLVEDCLDAVATLCETYKVEAVLDSFLVASGLPKRIGSEHVRRIANFALRVLGLEPTFNLPKDLRIKIGIHSGPCAAGVIGVKRPRYCLFGDTINVASRMCSQGMPGQIHLSSSSKQLLEEFNDHDYVIELRGLLKVKGRGDMTTYWLIKTSSIQIKQ
ncbi:atrial natriuretic peptide receptor 1-like [Paramacrobiotus metropolitanus]|uniref:atrial natriuretic peptide receptor 1-like n=1 Tax=Paramacrobiotus metropolitanus TaxID=2943436 RepID=UPI00244628FC|nr:atrial natriuretic peptide receptor 1-like [Paramacrobiotus metropolitanus]